MTSVRRLERILALSSQQSRDLPVAKIKGYYLKPEMERARTNWIESHKANGPVTFQYMLGYKQKPRRVIFRLPTNSDFRLRTFHHFPRYKL